MKHHPMVLEAIERGKIEWQMWANVLAVTGGALLILGGIIGQFGFENEEIATFSIVWGAVVCIIEWPRSARIKGHTIPRMFQGYIVRPLAGLGKFWTNLYFRSCLYIGASIPTFFELPTVFGGVTMIISGVVYLVAAFKGEHWKPLYPYGARRAKPGTTIEAPKQPPPRRPDTVTNKVIEMPSDAPPRKAAPQAPSPSHPPPSRPVPKPRGVTSSSAPKRPPPLLQPEADDAEGDWKMEYDQSSGQNYYYNTVTNETTWEKPPGVVFNQAYTNAGSPSYSM